MPNALPRAKPHAGGYLERYGFVPGTWTFSFPVALPRQPSSVPTLEAELAERRAGRGSATTVQHRLFIFSILFYPFVSAFVCFCYFSFAFRFLCFMVQSAMQLSISPVDDEDFGGKLACSVCYAVAVPNCSASGRFSGSQGELPGGDGTGQVRTHQWKKTVSCSHTVRTVFQYVSMLHAVRT